ncbi:DUF6415 family natural product biosynthesis protein [Streptomyces sp. NPDC048254]|uniref:DUF6415 family natural product biosynthesis protein n=1 Tax=Streptomyces sp. NPDC048254 TaxID=3365525 RepID=UPI003710C980
MTSGLELLCNSVQLCGLDHVWIPTVGEMTKPGDRANGPGSGRLDGVDVVQRTAPVSGETDTNRLPPDIETMRGTATRFLAPDARPIPTGDLVMLRATMRRQIEELIPTIEAMTRAFPAGDIPSRCALAGVQEARMRLGLRPGYNAPGQMTVAMKLARSVTALCDHYENLGGRPAAPPL